MPPLSLSLFSIPTSGIFLPSFPFTYSRGGTKHKQIKNIIKKINNGIAEYQ